MLVYLLLGILIDAGQIREEEKGGGLHAESQIKLLRVKYYVGLQCHRKRHAKILQVL